MALSELFGCAGNFIEAVIMSKCVKNDHKEAETASSQVDVDAKTKWRADAVSILFIIIQIDTVKISFAPGMIL